MSAHVFPDDYSGCVRCAALPGDGPECEPPAALVGLGSRILVALADGPMSRAAIAVATGASKGRVLRAIKRLATSGLVRALGGGRWEVGS